MSSHNPKEKLDAIIVNENFRILHEAREFAPGKRLQLFQIPDALSPKVDGWLNSVESDQNGGKQQQQQGRNDWYMIESELISQGNNWHCEITLMPICATVR